MVYTIPGPNFKFLSFENAIDNQPNCLLLIMDCYLVKRDQHKYGQVVIPHYYLAQFVGFSFDLGPKHLLHSCREAKSKFWSSC